MRAHGLGREHERAGDVLRAGPGGDQVEHLPLAVGQRAADGPQPGARAWSAAVGLDELHGETARDGRFTLLGPAQHTREHVGLDRP